MSLWERMLAHDSQHGVVSYAPRNYNLVPWQ